jgi:hypothetical protein
MFAVKSIPIEKLQLKYKDAKDYIKEVISIIQSHTITIGRDYEGFKAS